MISGKSSKADAISASSVPRKLRNASEVFPHSKEEYTDCVSQEVRIKKINTENLFKNNKVEEEKPSSPKVGKLKLEENIFEKSGEEGGNISSPEIKVGKIDSDNIFKQNKVEKDEGRSAIVVGKLDKNVYNPKSDDIKESQSDISVGKINTKDLFKEAEENSEELLSICKPGKLSEDKLKFSSQTSK